MQPTTAAPVVYSFMTANFGAAVVGCILWFSLPTESAFWAGCVGYLGVYFLFLGVTIFFIKKKVDASDGEWTIKSMLWEVYFGNILALRNEMQEVIGPVPFIWCFLMKHIIPNALIILFVNLAQSEMDDGLPVFGNYGGYPDHPYQILGIIVVAFTLLIFIVGVLFPDVYAPLALPQTEEAKKELLKYATAITPSEVEEKDDIQEVKAVEAVEQAA
jgi:hypothetical protein